MHNRPGNYFFFSSRRRHTRCLSDWSSDVCLFRSSPLSIADASTNVLNVDPAWRADCAARLNWLPALRTTVVIARIAPVPGSTETIAAAGSVLYRSEERRVGKERR